MKNNFKNFAFGALLFAALIPLSFEFSEGKSHLLFLPEHEWIGWLSAIVSAIVMVFYRNSLSRPELISLSALFALLPFSFYYSSGSFQFIFLLTSPVMAILYWIAAIIPITKIAARSLQK